MSLYYVCTGILIWTLIVLFVVAQIRRARRKSFTPFQPVTLHDNQLTAVCAAGVSFKKKPILYRQEYRAFEAAQRVLKKHNRTDCRLWAQVCIGELIVIEPSDTLQSREAHSSINSKRSDIVLTDSKGFAMAFIEYHGNKHYQNTALKRDAIKRLVAQRADIKFIEVIGEWSDQQIEDTIDNALHELLVNPKT